MVLEPQVEWPRLDQLQQEVAARLLVERWEAREQQSCMAVGEEQGAELAAAALPLGERQEGVEEPGMEEGPEGQPLQNHLHVLANGLETAKQRKLQEMP
jgi:hypothetical protein